MNRLSLNDARGRQKCLMRPRVEDHLFTKRRNRARYAASLPPCRTRGKKRCGKQKKRRRRRGSAANAVGLHVTWRRVERRSKRCPRDHDREKSRGERVVPNADAYCSQRHDMSRARCVGVGKRHTKVGHSQRQLVVSRALQKGEGGKQTSMRSDTGCQRATHRAVECGNDGEKDALRALSRVPGFIC